jgi:hypothetical protein
MYGILHHFTDLLNEQTDNEDIIESNHPIENSNVPTLHTPILSGCSGLATVSLGFSEAQNWTCVR